MGNDRGGGLGNGRRLGDDVRAWLPVILSLITMLLTFGVFYGRLGGRLDLIEYRLMTIENQLTINRNR